LRGDVDGGDAHSLRDVHRRVDAAERGATAAAGLVELRRGCLLVNGLAPKLVTEVISARVALRAAMRFVCADDIAFKFVVVLVPMLETNCRGGGGVRSDGGGCDVGDVVEGRRGRVLDGAREVEERVDEVGDGVGDEDDLGAGEGVRGGGDVRASLHCGLKAKRREDAERSGWFDVRRDIKKKPKKMMTTPRTTFEMRP
jgi:hypothetical protein